MKVCPTCKVEYTSGEAFCPVDATRLITPSQFAAGAPDADDPLVGTTLQERYLVVRRIGEGGMGLVYEGQHTVIEKRVAIKVLRDDFSSRPDVVQRFRQEAKSASRIGHEHIVDISDFGETPSGASYFVMEYLEGSDLADILETEIVLPPERVVQIALQCCTALGAAHDKGIVHRDMKPENIFMQRRSDGSDFVKIVDFGIAKMSDIETDGAPGRKLTKTGMIFGTPEYMSPEQAAGKELDHRVDIYAMGVILYELLTGSVPFVGDSFMGVLTQHMFDEPAPLRDKNPGLSMPLALEEVVYKAMAKMPEDRFQTMPELAEALSAAIEGRAVAAAGTRAGYAANVPAARREPREVGAKTTAAMGASDSPRSRKGLALGLLAALVLVGAGGFAASRLGAGDDDGVDGQDGSTVAPEAPDPGLDPAGPGSDPVEEPSVVEDVSPPENADEAPIPEAESPPELPATVAVNVETVPEGATITVGGDTVGCSPSPCTIEAPRGERLELRARKGRMQGSTEVTPENEMTVQMALVARRTRSGMTRPATMSGSSMTTTTSAMRSGDLKIPDIFR